MEIERLEFCSISNFFLSNLLETIKSTSFSVFGLFANTIPYDFLSWPPRLLEFFTESILLKGALSLSQLKDVSICKLGFDLKYLNAAGEFYIFCSSVLRNSASFLSFILTGSWQAKGTSNLHFFIRIKWILKLFLRHFLFY